MKSTDSLRLVVTGGLAVYGVVILRNPARYRLLDGVSLAMHEAGHLFFAPFGEFVGYLGGTLMQLLLPAAFVAYFLHEKDRHAASVALWWVAQNLANVSVYARDARSRLLPLVGGGDHDWNYLLGRLDLLDQDQVIGRVIHFLAVLAVATSVLGGLLAVQRRRVCERESTSGGPSTANSA